MSYTFSNFSLAELGARNSHLLKNTKFMSIFSLPAWLDAWWQVFGGDSNLLLAVFSQDDTEIGIAPLRVKNKKASFIGDGGVCDYLDFIIKKGKEVIFLKSLLDEQPFRNYRQEEAIPWVEEAVQNADITTNLRNESTYMPESYERIVTVVAKACFEADEECSDQIGKIIDKCSKGVAR